MLEGLLGYPTFADDLPAFFEALARFARRDIKSPEIAAPGHADDESAIGKIVQQRQLLAQPHRMVQWQTIPHQSDLHVLGQNSGHGDK